MKQTYSREGRPFVISYIYVLKTHISVGADLVVPCAKARVNRVDANSPINYYNITNSTSHQLISTHSSTTIRILLCGYDSMIDYGIKIKLYIFLAILID